MDVSKFNIWVLYIPVVKACSWLMLDVAVTISQQTQNIFITFIQCWTNVEDVGRRCINVICMFCVCLDVPQKCWRTLRHFRGTLRVLEYPETARPGARYHTLTADWPHIWYHSFCVWGVFETNHIYKGHKVIAQIIYRPRYSSSQKSTFM